MLTRKHFKAVAKIVSETANKAYQTTYTKDLTERLADYFATQNPQFDREWFMATCEPG